MILATSAQKEAERVTEVNRLAVEKETGENEVRTKAKVTEEDRPLTRAGLEPQ